MTQPLTPPDALNVKLQKHLRFTDDDIAANRLATLSKPQMAMLRRRRDLWVLALSVAIVVLVALLWVIWQDAPRSSIFEKGFGTILGLCLLAVTIIGINHTMRNTRHDLSDGVAKQVSGKVVRYTSISVGKTTSTLYNLQCQREKFEHVDQDLYDLFAEPYEYSLYFLPNTRIILSAEVRPQGDAKDKSGAI
jgi:hypothetical protein